jgi:hypothetical protein
VPSGGCQWEAHDVDREAPPTCPKHTPLGPLRTAGGECRRCGEITHYLLTANLAGVCGTRTCPRRCLSSGHRAYVSEGVSGFRTSCTPVSGHRSLPDLGSARWGCPS